MKFRVKFTSLDADAIRNLEENIEGGEVSIRNIGIHTILECDCSLHEYVHNMELASIYEYQDVELRN